MPVRLSLLFALAAARAVRCRWRRGASAQDRVVPPSAEALRHVLRAGGASAWRRRWSTSRPPRPWQNRNPLFDDPFFRRFFGRQSGGPREQVQRSLGSGVIVDPSGLIVTNKHVIEGADQVKVSLADKREFEVDVVLKDPRTDLAVLRVKDGKRTLSGARLRQFRRACRSATWCWRSAIRSASARP